MDHGSWIMDHGSWIMDHGSWIMDHGSWIMDHGSSEIRPNRHLSHKLNEADLNDF